MGHFRHAYNVQDKMYILKWGDNPYSFLEEAKELTFFTSSLETPSRFCVNVPQYQTGAVPPLA